MQSQRARTSFILPRILTFHKVPLMTEYFSTKFVHGHCIMAHYREGHTCFIVDGVILWIQDVVEVGLLASG